MSQKDLAERLSQGGRDVSSASINSKISRGTFSAAFLLEVLAALGASTVDFPD
jgi:hypothetical protein